MSDLDETLPVHPYTGLTAIGLRRNGAPIWPVMGAAPDDEPGDDEPDETGDDTGDGDEDKPLGPQGEKALQAEKDKRKQAAAKARAAEAENAKLKAELEKLRGDGSKDGKKDDGPSAEDIKAEARKEAQAEVLRERALDKVEAKAAKLFADPEDARALLADKVDEFIDGTQIDLDAITEALEELLKRKPHLAAQGGKRFEGSADQGSRKGGTRPAQLTRADLDRMNPDEIVAAKQKGQFDELLGIKR